MAGRQLDHRQIAWAAALTVIGVSLILLGFGQPTAHAGPLTHHTVAEMVCTVVCDTCSPQTYECHDDGGGGGYATPPGTGGNPTTCTPGGGSTRSLALPNGRYLRVIPPTGAPPSGYYTTPAVEAGFANCRAASKTTPMSRCMWHRAADCM